MRPTRRRPHSVLPHLPTCARILAHFHTTRFKNASQYETLVQEDGQCVLNIRVFEGLGLWEEKRERHATREGDAEGGNRESETDVWKLGGGGGGERGDGMPASKKSPPTNCVRSNSLDRLGLSFHTSCARSTT